jgi:His-Xaa-Ser system radical SAM maturase HxsB
MKTWPLNFRNSADGSVLFCDEAGGFFRSSEAFLERYAMGNLNNDDTEFLLRQGHAFSSEGDFQYVAFASRWANRVTPWSDLSYVILVPTLRCNLRCDYCQVSRVTEHATGFDWSSEELTRVINLLDGLKTKSIKIEFQGGEPLLNLADLQKVRDFCRSRFDHSEFVICTNLQSVTAEAWAFLDAADTHISTSFDGSDANHISGRTKTQAVHDEFEANLRNAISRFGTERVSALPTIDVNNPPAPEEVIRSYVNFGFQSIFLRRVNFQGFARKAYTFHEENQLWKSYYRRFITAIIAYNSVNEYKIEEFYLAHLLRRIFRGGHHNHVDLRNPNWLGADYLVIDYDGRLYPTDEARMVTRIGKMDLSIGSLKEGVDNDKLELLNAEVSINFNPDCMLCPYQAFCGSDIVDDLSRYGRIDLPKGQTYHCRSHLDLFDLAFELIYSDDGKVKSSLAAWLGVPDFCSDLAPSLS